MIIHNTIPQNLYPDFLHLPRLGNGFFFFRASGVVQILYRDTRLLIIRASTLTSNIITVNISAEA
jgi:hypothetical protein